MLSIISHKVLSLYEVEFHFWYFVIVYISYDEFLLNSVLITDPNDNSGNKSLTGIPHLVGSDLLESSLP